LDVLPNIPPIGEFVLGYEASSWDGVGAPANTSPEVIAIISKEANAALRDPMFKGRPADLAVEPFPISPTD
jgi:tripartite-type tricarboxylate transporter receptor subunit TctC